MKNKPTVVGLLLAAGSSQRFNGHKLLHPLHDNIPIALRAAQNLLDAVPNSTAVIRKGDKALYQLLSTTTINIIENPHATQGISSSIVCGVQSQLNADGWIIALADMPYIPTQIIQQVADAINAGANIVAPRYKNRRGHPVGFSKNLQNNLLRLHGDTGAKTLIDDQINDVQFIDVKNEGVLKDIDSRNDI